MQKALLNELVNECELCQDDGKFYAVKGSHKCQITEKQFNRLSALKKIKGAFDYALELESAANNKPNGKGGDHGLA